MVESQTIPSSSLTCRFCHGRVGTEHGQLQKLERHMENCHDMYYEKDFTLVLNILSDEEIRIIVEKIQPRIDSYKKYGFPVQESNILLRIPRLLLVMMTILKEIQRLKTIVKYFMNLIKLKN